jgi:hypothetical protein
MHDLATLGRTTFKTVGVRMYTDSGDPMSDISCFDEQMVLDGSPFFPSGSLSGAVVVMLGTDGSPGSSEIVVQSPHGQDDLETIERSIAQLTWVRDELSKTAAAA